MAADQPARHGEYAVRGDYHRALDPDWEYYPTYLAKMRVVRSYLDGLAPGTRVLDAGCGEGLLVEEYAGRLSIVGVDASYASPHVIRASVTALPFGDGYFARAVCLDVLEHLSYDDQASALGELARVVLPGGELLVSVPNLAHLQSRVQFLLRGRLIRTASPAKHPGDRPIAEYLAMARSAGFQPIWRRGIFPTVPVVTRLIRRHPARLEPVHRFLTRALPVPGLCFLNLMLFRRGAAA